MGVLTAWICPEFLRKNQTELKSMLPPDPLLLVPQAHRTRGHQRASPIHETKPWLPLLPPAKSKPHTSYVPISLFSSAIPHFRFFFFFSREAPKEHHTGDKHPCADGRACFIWINVLQRSDHCYCSTHKRNLIQYSGSIRMHHTWVCNLYSLLLQ